MNTQPGELPQFLNAKQVGTHLAITTRTLYREIARNRFPAPIKNGRMSRWLTSDVLRYVESLMQGKPPAGGRA